MVATVTHESVERLGHERRGNALFARDLLADLAVRDETVRGEFDPVVHPVEFQLSVVLVVPFDHVQSECLRIAHHLLEDRTHAFQVFHLVGGARAFFLDDLESGTGPHHLGFGAAADLVARACGEVVVGTNQQPARIGLQRSTAHFGKVRGFVGETEHSGDRRVPRQNDESVRVGQRNHLACPDSATNQFALSGRLQVGHGGAVQRNSFFEVSPNVPRRNHLGDHLGADGREHVINKFDARRGDFLFEVLNDVGLHVGGLVFRECIVVI